MDHVLRPWSTTPRPDGFAGECLGSVGGARESAPPAGPFRYQDPGGGTEAVQPWFAADSAPGSRCPSRSRCSGSGWGRDWGSAWPGYTRPRDSRVLRSWGSPPTIRHRRRPRSPLRREGSHHRRPPSCRWNRASPSGPRSTSTSRCRIPPPRHRRHRLRLRPRLHLRGRHRRRPRSPHRSRRRAPRRLPGRCRRPRCTAPCRRRLRGSLRSPRSRRPPRRRRRTGRTRTPTGA